MNYIQDVEGARASAMEKPTTPIYEQKANHGASVPDTIATPGIHKPQQEWLKSQGIDSSKQIRLVKLGHMRYQVPDVDKMTTFLHDFGMKLAHKDGDGRAWFAGTGPDQYCYYLQPGEKKFLGGTFEVESFAELEKASKVEGASKIEEMADAPGGGHIITLHDPEGFPINLMYGQTRKDIEHAPQRLLQNMPDDKPRQRRFQRFDPGPAAVYKLGHYGLCVLDFDKQLKWYTNNFNFMPTDLLYVEPEGSSGKKDVAIFAHVDRGEDLVDHHSFFMTSNPTKHVHHCSFEVHDFDTQQLGHQWLANKGYTSVWGVGRHILGSQIFDYWWDTAGHMIEHYADGDLVNKETPIGWGPAGHESLAVWGPEVPKWFLE